MINSDFFFIRLKDVKRGNENIELLIKMFFDKLLNF